MISTIIYLSFSAISTVRYICALKKVRKIYDDRIDEFCKEYSELRLKYENLLLESGEYNEETILYHGGEYDCCGQSDKFRDSGDV